jgi:hypothetical protein
VQPAVARLGERLRQHFVGQATELVVELDRGDADFGADHLEVHVAEVVLVAEDVAEHRVALAVGDEAHRDAGHRPHHRRARVQHRHRAAADGRHRRTAVALGDLGLDADRVREVRSGWQQGAQPAPRERAVADLAATGATQRRISPTE